MFIFSDHPINKEGDYIKRGGGLGTTMILPCDVCANPQPRKYTWSKDGEVILGADSNSFTIINSSEADFGNYTCTVTNDIDEKPFLMDYIPYNKLLPINTMITYIFVLIFIFNP